MLNAEAAREQRDITAMELAAIWSRHLLTFVYPAMTFAFLVSGPHRWWTALLWIIPGALLDYSDDYSGHVRRQPRADLPGWPFDLLLYAHFLLQIVNVMLLVQLFTVQSFWSVDAFMAVQFVGGASGVSGIVVAHELIHRRQAHLQLMGRALMATVLYEHFFTEHVRGHHVRVGTPEDPATARFGETFWAFLRRTVPGQFRSAWRLETKRLGDESMSLTDPRLLRSRVVHGLVVEWAIAVAILLLAGPASFGVFVLQAVMAVGALEGVNYFEHWGLMRSGRKVQPVDSWDSDARFTYYSLVGLTRHADHHAHASRPYQLLRLFEDSPKLPRGYHGMLRLLVFQNRRFQRVMTAELRRRQLGPFAPDAVAASVG
jgi:alkane 1-monooxygenase